MTLTFSRSLELIVILSSSSASALLQKGGRASVIQLSHGISRFLVYLRWLIGHYHHIFYTLFSTPLIVYHIVMGATTPLPIN